MENNYYQRSKLANVLGISKETLRYYEDKHIIEPKRDPSNGYRAYDGYDCQTLPIMSSPKIKKYWALTNISTSSIFAKQSQIGMNSPRISCRIVSRGHGKPGIRLVRI